MKCASAWAIGHSSIHVNEKKKSTTIKKISQMLKKISQMLELQNFYILAITVDAPQQDGGLLALFPAFSIFVPLRRASVHISAMRRAAIAALLAVVAVASASVCPSSLPG
jgi:hypothetical protein